MQALVIYESMFGNTRDVARAVGSGLFRHMDVEVVEVGTATQRIGPEVDLLVVGGPTHAFSMSRASTRTDAAEQTGASRPVSQGIGVREWLAGLSVASSGIPAAAFDTRVSSPRVPGSAARGMQKRLKRSGFELIAPVESFWVTGTVGPLLPRETERAKAWGEQLGRTMADRRHRRPAMRV